MTMLIPLSQGKHAIVDDEDYDFLMQWKWHVMGRYAGRVAIDSTTRKQSSVAMHRVILDTPQGMHSDHINGDGLDNRRENLRICTPGENVRNQKANKRRVGDAQYKGTFFVKELGKWKAVIGINGKTQYLGLFDCEDDAARAYDQKARELFGDFVRPNFPNQNENSAIVPHENTTSDLITNALQCHFIIDPQSEHWMTRSAILNILRANDIINTRSVALSIDRVLTRHFGLTKDYRSYRGIRPIAAN
jgi:hypothetical protein